MKTRSLRRTLQGRSGQTAIEYLLTTLALVTVFAGMFGIVQKGLKDLFKSAGIKILSTYPK